MRSSGSSRPLPCPSTRWPGERSPAGGRALGQSGSEARLDPGRRRRAAGVTRVRSTPGDRRARRSTRDARWCRSPPTTTWGWPGHPAVVTAAHEALDRWGAGAGASRLVTGTRPVHPLPKRRSPTGTGPRPPSSFRPGSPPTSRCCRCSGTPGTPGLLRRAEPRHDHRRMPALPFRRLGLPPPPTSPTWGRARLRAPAVPAHFGRHRRGLLHGRRRRPPDGLAALCRRHGALLVLDEAHAVLGPHAGDATSPTTHGQVVRVGTLSKTLGSLGGFVAASRDVVDLLVNRARSYIFSTAPTPADAAAALAALGVLDPPTGRPGRRGWPGSSIGCRRPGTRRPATRARSSRSCSGAEQAALDASAALLDEGLWVRPSGRPRCPSAPAGSGSRCRRRTRDATWPGCCGLSRRRDPAAAGGRRAPAPTAW